MIERYVSVYQKNIAAFETKGIRRTLNEGGTSSGKTYSIIQLLINIAEFYISAGPIIISIISESLPHLKRGCIRDFYNIMGDRYNADNFNKSEYVYRYDNKNIIEFFSADDPAKMRGGRRDILFINECNNVAYDSYRELDIRTKLFTFLDWNPVSEFWVHENELINYPENAYIHSTYLDALSVLSPEVIKNIESNKDRDPNWWNVYGLGKIGKIAGLVYPNFTIIDKMLELARKRIFFGLDFGWNDPIALVKNTIHEKNLYSEEIIYETHLNMVDFSQRMELAGVKKHYDEIFADCEDPGRIEELCRYGWNVKPCIKGKNSVDCGHQKVNQFKQHWTKISTNCIKEQRNFMYIKDKDGKFTEKTTHSFSHGMDARRYGVMSMEESQYDFSTLCNM